MVKASDNEFPSVLLDEQASAPTTPATGFWRVYAKSDGLYLVDDAGAETGPLGTGSGGGGGGLLAYTQYKPATDTTTAITSSTPGDLDATNLSVTFTVPSSGDVLVRLSCYVRIGTFGQVGYWGLRDGSTLVSGSDGRITQTDHITRVTYQTVITGLTPSASETWKWAAWRLSTSNFDHFYGDDTPFGPALMEVWEA